jgi:imidazolonepropionase-like amidohydrolase
MPARDDAPYDDAFTLPARLAAAGIRFTICNADDAAHERNTPYSVATAVKHGLEPEIGLRCITLDAAKIFGVADRYGSLETGKSATLIVTTGDPLEVMTDITAAYVDGRRIDLSNKQTELAEKYRERYRQIGELKEPRKP